MGQGMQGTVCRGEGRTCELEHGDQCGEFDGESGVQLPFDLLIIGSRAGGKRRIVQWKLHLAVSGLSIEGKNSTTGWFAQSIAVSSHRKECGERHRYCCW